MSQPWSNHYSVNKPRCLDCLTQGITENEYKFCSLEKKPSSVYDERGTSIVHVFNNIYSCNVYHWTIYQGQGKVNQEISTKPTS